MGKPIYSHLTTGKRAGLTNLWNRHRLIDTVARDSGVPADVVEAYLKTRDGYPGSITGCRPQAGRRLRPQPNVKAHHLTGERRVPITLPRVSCLERK